MSYLFSSLPILIACIIHDSHLLWFFLSNRLILSTPFQHWWMMASPYGNHAPLWFTWLNNTGKPHHFIQRNQRPVHLSINDCTSIWARCTNALLITTIHKSLQNNLPIQITSRNWKTPLVSSIPSWKAKLMP